MKLSIFSLITFLFFSLNAHSQSALVWKDLNSSMADIVDEHVDMYEIWESGQIIFDEVNSDLSKGKLGLNFLFNSAELKLLSTTKPQRISIVGDLNINTIDAGTLKKVDFQSSIEIQGDLLLTLKHINQLFGDCTQVDPDFKNKFLEEFCKYSLLVEQAKSAKELKLALEALRNAILNVLSNDPNDPFRMLIQSLQIVEQLDSVLVSLLVNNLEVFGLKLSGDVSLTFTDKGLLINITGSALLSAKDYANFQNQLEALLIGLQDKDPGSVDMFTSYSYFLFDLLEGIFL
jgi:hypothetical protein